MTFDNEKETHPSYGMLSFHRVSRSAPTTLYGSSITHRDTIQLTLKRGSFRRDLNQDWRYGEEQLFQVEMSYNQFAELVSAFNVGDGVPVTIRYLGYEPVEDPPTRAVGEIHREEFREEIDKANKEINDLLHTLTNKFSQSGTLKKAEREEILSLLHQLSMKMGTNKSFQLSQFQRQMDKTTTEAKAEVEAFVQHKLLQLGGQKLVEEYGTRFLPELSPEEKPRRLVKSKGVTPYQESKQDYYCPKCHSYINWDGLNDTLDHAPKHCQECGVKFDWSDLSGQNI